MTRKEKALELFSGEFNCAQSVIGAYNDLLTHKYDTLVEMAVGFGGGMGRLQLTCGAITGAFMVLNSLFDHKKTESKEQLNFLMQEFAGLFRNKFGEMNCRNLIQHDLKTEEGRKKARDNNVFETKCAQYISYAIDLIEDILRRYQMNLK